MQKQAEHNDLIIHWYDQYSSGIFKYILKMLRDSHQAQDLTHDTFIKAYQYIARDNNIDYPKSFLFRTAHNLTIDHIRKNTPINIVKDIFMNKDKPQESTESIVEMKEEVNEVMSALQNLKVAHRQVIILRKIEGFSIRETAQILNWSESKVKSTMLRAITKLENELIKGGFINETS